MMRRDASLECKLLVAELQQIQGGASRCFTLTLSDGSKRDLPVNGQMWNTFQALHDSRELAAVTVTRGDLTVFAREIDPSASESPIAPQKPTQALQGPGPYSMARQATEITGAANVLDRMLSEPLTISPDCAPDDIQRLQLYDALQHRAFVRTIAAQTAYSREVMPQIGLSFDALQQVIRTQQSIIDRLSNVLDSLQDENEALRAQATATAMTAGPGPAKRDDDDDDDDSLKLPPQITEIIGKAIGEKLESWGKQIVDKQDAANGEPSNHAAEA